VNVSEILAGAPDRLSSPSVQADGDYRLDVDLLAVHGSEGELADPVVQPAAEVSTARASARSIGGC
jgi:hypothetical protein